MFDVPRASAWVRPDPGRAPTLPVPHRLSRRAHRGRVPARSTRTRAAHPRRRAYPRLRRLHGRAANLAQLPGAADRGARIAARADPAHGRHPVPARARTCLWRSARNVRGDDAHLPGRGRHRDPRTRRGPGNPGRPGAERDDRTAALDGRPVRLLPADGAALTSTVDDLGNFEFEAVAPGPYVLELDLPGALVIIEELRLD